MIKNINIKYDFSKCDSKEFDILSKYWDYNIDGEFNITLTQICKDYGIKQNELYNLANKFPLEWNFGNCECGNSINAKLNKRVGLLSCFNGSGTVDSFHTILYYKKCVACNDIEYEIEKEKSRREEERWLDESIESTYPSSEINTDSISKLIKSLSPFEIKILFQIYKLQNFNLIKNSTEIFPVKYGEHKNFVWKTIYKFDNLGLISADKTGSFINDIVFFDYVSEMLDYMFGELEPFIEYTDLELALIRIVEGNKTKYFSILEPDTDIILKAGNKYEFVATLSTDKNVLLRIININSIQTSETIDKDFDNSFKDTSPY